MPKNTAMKRETLQEKMLNELRGKDVFERAQRYAYAYLENAPDRHVFPTEEALAALALFDEPLPSTSTNADEVIDALHRYGAPATLPNLGGRYFGFVTGSVLPVGLAAKTLSAYWDQNTPLYVCSPLASELESVVEKWLVALFGLPRGAAAGFVSGSSAGSLCGLAAARYQVLANQGWDIEKKGLYGAPPIRIMASRNAHSSVLKAIHLLGLGKQHIEWLDVDEQGRVLPEKMPVADARTVVVLQAGDVDSGAFDPFSKIIPAVRAAGAWVHVDGAFGLWAEGCAALRSLTKGMADADSWATDGHKTLNTPYDCGIVMCRNRDALTRALHTKGDYLIESPQRDGMFYTPELSRRARVIELWATLKYLGREGIDQLVEQLHTRARQFAERIRAVSGFYIDNEVVFNQVLVRCDSDSLTDKVLQRLQEQRVCWAGGSRWRGNRVIRVSVCAWTTTEEDIEKAAHAFRQALEKSSITPT